MTCLNMPLWEHGCWDCRAAAGPGSSRLSDHRVAVQVPALPHARCFSLPSYVMPSCESDARAKSAEVDDPFKDRELPGGR